MLLENKYGRDALGREDDDGSRQREHLARVHDDRRRARDVDTQADARGEQRGPRVVVPAGVRRDRVPAGIEVIRAGSERDEDGGYPGGGRLERDLAQRELLPHVRGPLGGRDVRAEAWTDREHPEAPGRRGVPGGTQRGGDSRSDVGSCEGAGDAEGDPDVG